MGILDGFIGLAELTQGMGKARINVWGDDEGAVRKYLKKHGIKANCGTSPEGVTVCVPKEDEDRAYALLKRRFR